VIALVLAASVVLVVEVLRWMLRPEARRLRVIKKIGVRR
jgi:uncharacterized protein YjeT (DUF2065 family)